MRAIAVGAVYFGLAAVSLSLTRFDGGVAFIWVSNALLLAELARIPPRHWEPTLAACAIASFAATAMFGVGAFAAPALAAANIIESCIGALMLRRFAAPFARLETAGSAVGLALVAIVTAAVSGLPGAGAVALVTGREFGGVWFQWITGHAFGTIAFAPVMLLSVQADLRRLWARRNALATLEAIGYGLINVAIALAVFGQSRYPLLFLPLLPLIATTFRFRRGGAALSVAMLALIGTGMTLSGNGPAHLIAAATADRLEFLQFYLAVAVLTVLPVAAVLDRRDALVRALGEQEARFRALADRSGDVILDLTCDGVIRYASPSISEIGGFAAANLVGKSFELLVHPRHHRRLAAAQARTLAEPDTAIATQYLVQGGFVGERWVETTSRAIVDDGGVPAGMVCVLRDITERKLAEADQARAAATDALTGIANRRTLVAALADAAPPGEERHCALLDLDYFKQINDAHGHDAGDRALQAFASLAVDVAGTDGLVARIGGEEFVILFAGIDLEAARERCELLRRATADLRVPLRDGRAVSFTVSIGLIAIPDGSEPGSILADADAALYRAKAGGRDRLAVDGRTAA